MMAKPTLSVREKQPKAEMCLLRLLFLDYKLCACYSTCPKQVTLLPYKLSHITVMAYFKNINRAAMKGEKNEAIGIRD